MLMDAEHTLAVRDAVDADSRRVQRIGRAIAIAHVGEHGQRRLGAEHLQARGGRVQAQGFARLRQCSLETIQAFIVAAFVQIVRKLARSLNVVPDALAHDQVRLRRDRDLGNKHSVVVEGAANTARNTVAPLAFREQYDPVCSRSEHPRDAVRRLRQIEIV